MSWFVKISSSNVHCQTVRARELKFWEKVPLLPPVRCQVSQVMCHMTHVMCHMTHVTCHLLPVTCPMSCVFLVFFCYFGISCEASQGRVCYQRGWPRLVFINTNSNNSSVLQICKRDIKVICGNKNMCVSFMYTWQTFYLVFPNIINFK